MFLKLRGVSAGLRCSRTMPLASVAGALLGGISRLVHNGRTEHCAMCGLGVAASACLIVSNQIVMKVLPSYCASRGAYADAYPYQRRHDTRVLPCRRQEPTGGLALALGMRDHCNGTSTFQQYGAAKFERSIPTAGQNGIISSECSRGLCAAPRSHHRGTVRGSHTYRPWHLRDSNRRRDCRSHRRTFCRRVTVSWVDALGANMLVRRISRITAENSPKPVTS